MRYAHLCGLMTDEATHLAVHDRGIALEVAGLGKAYRVHTDEGEKTIHALQGVDLVVKRGSSLGIVGRNGCGKTTLLKIIGGLVRPTTGTVTVHGSLLAITDVGGGFVPDLTGLENIRLNAKMYGLKETEMGRIIPLIAQFSEIEEFFHVPVKSYSQGMFLRLAFSTMIHLPVDIVLLDEVLAVGDVAFRAKCYSKLRELSANGLTVLMVSHTYDEIAAFCDRCLVLDLGRVRAFGPPDATFDAYQQTSGHLTMSGADDGDLASHFEYVRPGHVEIEAFSISAQGGTGSRISVTQPIELTLRWNKLRPGFAVAFHLALSDEMGRPVIDTANFYGRPIRQLEMMNVDDVGVFSDSCVIPPKLLNCGVLLVKLSATVYQTVDDHFTVLETVRPFTILLFDDPEDRESTFWTYSPAPVRTPFLWSRKALETASI
jgi:ABC-type polysaccharide/polyol phosphate transport system ATPase subunit